MGISVSIDVKFFVGDWHSYNTAGGTRGAWVEASDDAEEMREAVAEVLRANEAANADGVTCEEVAIWDWDDETGAFADAFGESFDAEAIAQLFSIAEEYPEQLALEADAVGLDTSDLDTLRDHLEEWIDTGASAGYNLDRALGEYLIFEAGYMEVPEHLTPYIDCEAYGRDCGYELHTGEDANGNLWYRPQN